VRAIYIHRPGLRVEVGAGGAGPGVPSSKSLSLRYRVRRIVMRVCVRARPSARV
jgi:hypothetical protein